MMIAYDVALRRPGCAIVQAGLGGTLGVANAFDSVDWLTHPTDDMRLYEVDDDQLERLVALTREARR